MMCKTQRWGLVLSGGAAWGIANAGVLEVFERERFAPDCVAGSSMGAIVGALFCMGISSQKMKAIVEEISIIKIAKPAKKLSFTNLHQGFFKQQLDVYLKTILGDACIGDCKIPFTCVAGRVKQPILWHAILKEGFTQHAMECIEFHVFDNDTRILDALHATSAIPVLFAPAKIGSEEYVDLCTFGAIPARTLRRHGNADIVIATDTTPSYDTLRSVLPKSWREFIEAGNQEAEKSREACDLVITPSFSKGAFRFDSAVAFYDAGKKSAEQAIPSIRKLLT
jgi:NTE family protein